MASTKSGTLFGEVCRYTVNIIIEKGNRYGSVDYIFGEE